MTGKSSGISKANNKEAVDIFSGSLTMLQTLTGLFTVTIGLLDAFYIINSLSGNLFNNDDLNRAFIKIVLFLIVITLFVVTASVFWSCTSLLSHVWKSENILSSLSIQVLGTGITIALIFLGNVFIIILLI